MPLAILSALLWDLRAQCEQQVRALTDAQKQLDSYRDSTTPQLRDAALAALTSDIERVLKTNRSVRESAEEVRTEVSKLAAEQRRKP
jgi:hypothetical protein